MHIVWEIAVLVFPVFASYAIRSHAVTDRLGAVLSEEMEGLQPGPARELIAPPAQARSLWVAVLLGAVVLGLGLHLFPWYWALGAFAGSILLILLMNYFIPSERTPHYLMVILKHLKKRADALDAAGEKEEGDALRDLAEKLAGIAGKRRLFDDKAQGY